MLPRNLEAHATVPARLKGERVRVARKREYLLVPHACEAAALDDESAREIGRASNAVVNHPRRGSAAHVMQSSTAIQSDDVDGKVKSMRSTFFVLGAASMATEERSLVGANARSSASPFCSPPIVPTNHLGHVATCQQQ